MPKTALRNRVKELRYVTASELEPHPLQHRLHPDKQKKALEAALREIGIAGALLAYEHEGKLRLIDGHGRREVAPDAAFPVLVLDVTEAEARQILAQHDALAGLAEVDAGALDALLREVSSGEEALQALFSEMATDAGLYEDEKPGKGGDDFDVEAAVPQGETRSRLGDIWQLGNHRVLCGDSTDAAQVARLMRGEKAQAAVTDPPYAIYGSSTGIGGDITDDNMVRPFWRCILDCIIQNTPLKAHVYIFCDWRSYSSWWQEIKQKNIKILNCIVWDKGDGGLGSMYTQRHEFTVFCERERIATTMTSNEGMVKSRVVHGKANVQRFNVPQHNERHHNAAKPVELLRIFIEASTKVEEIVLDPFLGGGSTLIACERTNRQCRGIELEPRYADVILARWEAETGKTAELLERLS